MKAYSGEYGDFTAAVRRHAAPVVGAPVIEIQGLRKQYGDTVIHDNLDLTVRRGEVLGLVGGSGSGKTTLVRQILALEAPTAGTIRVFGEALGHRSARLERRLRNRIGMLFQHGALFSSLSVYDNIAQPVREFGRVPDDLMTDIVRLKLEMVGLTMADAAKMPADLSGGMVKRVGIARAIVLEPELLFLDEPTAGLDPAASEAFVDLIGTLHRALGLTVVMVTHDLDTLVALANRVAVLANKRVLGVGSVETVAALDDPFVNEYFLGERGLRALGGLPPERLAAAPERVRAALAGSHAGAFRSEN
ncbi:ABC transporter ATP-binding protein [Chitinasiproducens palmae]|uniref:Phospholipid/cholesterol/gamma-HCH transport system ATP-binding protein n=1 Tax=Chitinasiproducens palmae TaxID=1770053 RepID=A0A1H2PNT0_9BURK|nr:ATP-binding cassette domain-containing protein [Chitinasiproducens palmae]SDV48364.1 phospholipid/cholesterol/gamma-HCH transport system ATP-binding protein [Chitinasiproducens palmae]